MNASPRLSLLLLAVLPALLPALSAAPAAAQPAGAAAFSRTATIPNIAVDTVPTQLVFGTASFFTTNRRPPIAQREGNTLRLYVDAAQPFCNWPSQCYDPPPIVAHQADLGLLPAGVYRLELYLGLPPAAGGPAPFLQDTAQLDVILGPRLLLPPAPPLDGEAATARVDWSPTVLCLLAGGPGRVDGRIVEVPAVFDCDAGSQTSGLPPLPAGVYEARLMIEGQVYASEPLVVLPCQPRLQDGRFEVAAAWSTAAGERGPARLVQLPSADSALFYFFSQANWELMVKVLDGCAINGHFWVFSAASTDAGFTVAVKDLQSGRTFEFANPVGHPAGAINAIDAFPCP